MSGGSAVITNNKFASVQFAYGTASAFTFFGIGGNNKDALVLEAKRNLYLNHQLKPNEAIGQTTVDFKKTMYFPFVTTKVTISAEIIDFSESKSDTLAFQNFTGNKSPKEFALGEKVTFINHRTSINATVIDFDRGKYVIKYFNKHNNLKIKYVYASSLLKKDGSSTNKEMTSSSTKLDTTKKAESITLFTPKDARKNRLIQFKYRGNAYTGELIKKEDDKYLIKMQRSNGKIIGIYIPEKDIIK